MPAKSEKQRRLFAIAEHKPSKLFKKNRSLARMSKQKLHEFAEGVKEVKTEKKKMMK